MRFAPARISSWKILPFLESVSNHVSSDSKNVTKILARRGDAAVRRLPALQVAWRRSPAAALLRDGAGNLYGSTIEGGQHGAGGTVFELSPVAGGWNFSVLYSFVRGVGPFAPLTMDAVGDLYGTTVNGGILGFGTVFELSPSANGWTYNPLHDFTGGTDGGEPISIVLIGPDGALYGTAYDGGDLRYCGQQGCGVVWQITP